MSVMHGCSVGTNQHPKLQSKRQQQQQQQCYPRWIPRNRRPECLPCRQRQVRCHRQLYVAGARGRHDGGLPVGDIGAAGAAHQPHADELRRHAVVVVVQRVRRRRWAVQVPRHRRLRPTSFHLGQSLTPIYTAGWCRKKSSYTQFRALMLLDHLLN